MAICKNKQFITMCRGINCRVYPLIRRKMIKCEGGKKGMENIIEECQKAAALAEKLAQDTRIHRLCAGWRRTGKNG